MAIREVLQENGSNIKTYMCASTDLEVNYPTNADCDPLSKMIVIDETTKKASKYLFFDGLAWNEV